MQSLHMYITQRLSKSCALLTLCRNQDSFLSRGEIARKSILIASRSSRREKKVEHLSRRRTWPMAIAKKKQETTCRSCMYKYVRNRLPAR